MKQSDDDPPENKGFLVHLPGLDGIRGLAILVVMFTHFISIAKLDHGNPLHRLMLSGFLGVDLFFVLSGFLITGILVAAKGSKNYFRAFYMRRVLRIFPLYYLILTVAFLSVRWLTPQEMPKFTGADSAWWHWLYASNIGIAFKGDWLQTPRWVAIGHFWSLAVEEQFYMFWPFVVFLLSKAWLKRLCVVLVIASPLTTAVMSQFMGSLPIYVSTIGRLGELTAGAWLSLAWRDPLLRVKIERLAVPAAWALGILLLLERTVLPLIRSAEPTMALIFSAALVALAARQAGPGLGQRFFESGMLRWLGKYSYGLYVYHHALKPVWRHFLWNGGIVPVMGNNTLAAAVYTIAAFIVTAAVAWLSWKWIEAPILGLKKRFAYQSPAG